MDTPAKRTHTPWFDYEVDAEKFDTMCQDLAAFNTKSPEECLDDIKHYLRLEKLGMLLMAGMIFFPFKAPLPNGTQSDGVAYAGRFDYHAWMQYGMP